MVLMLGAGRLQETAPSAVELAPSKVLVSSVGAAKARLLRLVLVGRSERAGDAIGNQLPRAAFSKRIYTGNKGCSKFAFSLSASLRRVAWPRAIHRFCAEIENGYIIC